MRVTKENSLLFPSSPGAKNIYPVSEDYIPMRALLIILSVYGMIFGPLSGFPYSHGGYTVHTFRESSIHREVNEFAIPNRSLINASDPSFPDKKDKEHKLPFHVASHQLLILTIATPLPDYSKTIAVGCARLDIIFPFHSFW